MSADIRLRRLLSEGGMGSVWVADHRKLRTEVAVKLMLAELADEPRARARFDREATNASRVRSPHVVQILDYGVSVDGAPFIVMELLDGRDLRARLQVDRALPPAEALSIAEQLAHALGRAHEKGIVHRDLKPSNVFLCDAGGGSFVKLLDFGIAKEARHDEALTTTGSIGTPCYMSPEQLTGERAVDHRADLWALGVVVFEMLTGNRPFVGGTAAALALAIHTVPLPSAKVHISWLPDSFDAWFARACARHPDDRYRSAAEAIAALETALAPVLRIDARAHSPKAGAVATQTDAPFWSPVGSRSLRPPRAGGRLVTLGASLAALTIFTAAVLIARNASTDSARLAAAPSPRASSELGASAATSIAGTKAELPPANDVLAPEASEAPAPRHPQRSAPEVAADAGKPASPRSAVLASARADEVPDATPPTVPVDRK